MAPIRVLSPSFLGAKETTRPCPPCPRFSKRRPPPSAHDDPAEHLGDPTPRSSEQSPLAEINDDLARPLAAGLAPPPSPSTYAAVVAPPVCCQLQKAKYNYLTKPIKFFCWKNILDKRSTLMVHLLLTIALLMMKVAATDAGMRRNCVENDSDTIGHNSPTEGNSSSVKRKPLKSPKKKPQKGKGSSARVSEDDMASCIVRLTDKIAVAAPNEQLASTNPYAPFWKRIESLTITSRDKLELATYLGKPEHETFRSYLNCASELTFQTWVMDYFSKKDAVGASPSAT